MRILESDLLCDEQGISDEELPVILTRRELDVLAGAINETLEALDDWEFETRMGATQADVLSLRSQILSLLR